MELNLVKRHIVEDFISQVGRHDQREVYAEPQGDPGLMGPDSVSWKLHSDASAVATAGIAAITLELLHPSVMAGVGLQSNYREEPFRRAQMTFGWLTTTTFGNTTAAEGLIARVKRMHSRVHGNRPDGKPYSALDPELLAWVHTCIPWGVMTAYERFNGPLTVAEKNAYLTEQSVVALKSGADEVPTTMADLDTYIEEMRPNLEVGELTREFFDFLIENPKGTDLPAGRLARSFNRFQVESGMSLAPRWAQEMAGFDRPKVVQRFMQAPTLHAYAHSLRWAMGTPPWRALADERMGLAGGSREHARRSGGSAEPPREWPRGAAASET